MTAPSERAYIGIGSNLSDPVAQVTSAFDALARLPRSRLVARSHLYRSAPWGVAAQPDFVNAAAAVETGLSPSELLRALLEIERARGRERGADRWGPRVLDLDLLVHGERIVDEPGVRVPHPHLHERAFALVPLADVAPDLEIPGRGAIRDLLAAIGANPCRRLD